MNILRILVMALLAVSVVAAEPTWNPADAVKEAEQDIRAGHIKFYWSGSIASMPVGVPIEVAKKYPKANAGVGCVTNDIPLPGTPGRIRPPVQREDFCLYQSKTLEPIC